MYYLIIERPTDGLMRIIPEREWPFYYQLQWRKIERKFIEKQVDGDHMNQYNGTMSYQRNSVRYE